MLQKFSGAHRAPQALPLELDRKRIYIVPTRFGFFFALVLLVLLLGGLNYNNNMALLYTFLLAAVALLSPLYTVRNLSGLRVVQVVAPPVFYGEVARFILTLQNPSSSPRPMVWARDKQDATFTDIEANGRSDVSVEVATRRRGWLDMPRSRLTTTYPVGLFYAWTWVHPPYRCLVYPKPEVDAPPLPMGGQAGTGQPERRGDEEWAGLRDYQPGDPSRLIAWKVVARTDQMVTKTFADHRSQELHLDYSQIDGLDLERRLSRLTRWVLDADKARLRYSLKLPNQQVGPDSGELHKHQCLRALAEYQP
ncbi:MAG: DUF58 domain-containing protein [Xanthomonadales bacterium]|nr:DUF58 domain-containing protein [Xanthomonadales bacterium]